MADNTADNTGWCRVTETGKRGTTVTLTLHLQLGVQGVRQQAHIAQCMAQTFAKGFTGEKQVFQQQAVKGGQVLGQIEAHMLFAAFINGGFPEQCLSRVGEAPGRQTTRRQANPRQHAIRVGTAGTQGIYHGAHQRHVVSQVAHVEKFLLCARRGHLRRL